MFKESTSIPLTPLLVYSTLISILVAALLTWMALPLFSTNTPVSNFMKVFAATFMLMAIALKWSKRTTVKIQDMLQFNGRREPTLIIRGGARAQITYVPLESIEDVRVIEFRGPWWKLRIEGEPEDTPAKAKQPTFWQSFFSLRTEDDSIPIDDKSVNGYRGEGLLVTYRAKTLTSGRDMHLWRVIFPTQQSAELMGLLVANPGQTPHS